MKKPLIVFSILLFSLPVLAQQKEAGQKLSHGLRKIIDQRSNDSTDIICSVKDMSSWKTIKTNARIIATHLSSKTVIVRIATKNISGFIENNSIEFADVLRKPKEELTTGAFDLTLNKLNLAHHLYQDINGNGINASIKEQLLDSTDIDWKGRYFNSGVGSDNQTSHASIMATMLAGGGNSSPYAVGAAPGAAITSSSFATLLPEADAVYKQYAISVQNHSYGTGIENYYGADAKAYDISVNTNPSLVHIFSAGNSGASAAASGTYAGVQGFANITGSFKMAKNIITVGSVDSFNNVMPLSSKGPAYDGRIKPELVAYGEDGSSGAAALTSGTVALLQQAYKLMHHDSLPSAALVKAVLLNGADDVDAKGIDYSSGYGSLNAFSSLQTIKTNHFFESSVSQNQTKTFTINVPANTKQLKLTIAWSDTAADANAAKALVNDIDAVLKLPATAETWQPWVLNSFPNKDSLLLPAVRKKDTLNTVEQISIDDPQTGDYLIQIFGSHIINASQTFAVAYQVDTANNFLWSYPTASDILVAGSINTIRWQTNISADAQIQYSLNGTDWQTIAANLPATQQYFKWLAADTVSKALLRLTIPSANRTIVSDTFVISQKLNLKIGFNCPDSVLLWWNKLSVNEYEVYQLGQRYMEPIAQTTDTIKVLQKNTYPSLYYAVAPKVGNENGLRSFTLNYTTQGVECYLRTFFAALQNGNKAFLTAELGSLYNVAELNFQQLTATGFQTIHKISPLSSLTVNYADSSLLQGANFYRLQIKLSNGQTIHSPIDKVYYLPGNPVLVFPNPAKQNEPIKIVTQEPGNYSIQIFDANGRLIKSIFVDDILQQTPLMHLSAGMYFIKIISNDGKVYHQKLIVY
jgi:hypothetical protein